MNFDNDGTLCEYAWPNIGAEKENVTAYVRKKKKDGWIVILWTNRTGKHLAEAVEWCHKKRYSLGRRERKSSTYTALDSNERNRGESKNIRRRIFG